VLDGAYRRSLRLPHGAGVVELRPAEGHVHARYWLDDLRDLAAAMQRSRALLDLDSDPQSVLEVLGEDPLLGALVRGDAGAPRARARRRRTSSPSAPCSVSRSPCAARARSPARLLGAAASRSAPAGHGHARVPNRAGARRRDPEQLAMPRARRRALLALADALARGGARARRRRRSRAGAQPLLALPGIGPWTASTSRCARCATPTRSWRATSACATRSSGSATTAARHAARLAERWRPYRAYAVRICGPRCQPRARSTVRPLVVTLPPFATPVGSLRETRPSADRRDVHPPRRVTA
jgi:AraC family transcriptional regulator of adaptative response / DNA-3-methyladenine glycosylase II